MNIREVIGRIGEELEETFVQVDTWFDQPKEVGRYKPRKGGWSIDEILEHIMLTSHYLLILIDKGVRKAKRKAHGQDLEAKLKHYRIQMPGLEDIGISRSFEWTHPDHMKPTGEKPKAEVRKEINEQKCRCAKYLNELKNGEGILHKTTMTVNNLGKLDVYQYMYFLVKHAQRHVQQMEKVMIEFESSN